MELHIPTAASLKEKRTVVKSLKDRLHNKFNVSVAEVDFHDKWQRAEIAVVLVSGQKRFADETMQKIFNYMDSDGSFEISKYSFDYR